MTGAAIRITVNDEAINAALARLEKKSGSKQPLMEQIGASLLASTQLRFEREQAPDGSPWPKSIRAALEGGQTLTDSARLKQSLTYVATEDAVEVGTNVIYAAIHQFGGRITAKNAKALRFKVAGQTVQVKSVDIPARPFLGIDDEDRIEIEQIVADYLEDAA